MNKPMAVWGVLLLAGFLFTDIVLSGVMTAATVSLDIMGWVILVAIGVVYWKMTCKCRKFFHCDCGISGVWIIGIVEGLALTVAVAIQLLQISPYYVLSFWLLSLGAAMVGEGFHGKSIIRFQIGMLWLFSAVFFPFVNDFQAATFVVGALVFGVPLLVAGCVEKK